MIRFRGERNGKPFIGLGVSRENIRRLTAGQPIVLTGESINLPEIDSVVVIFGETEASLAKDLAPYIGRETVVHVDPKLEGGSAGGGSGGSS